LGLTVSSSIESGKEYPVTGEISKSTLTCGLTNVATTTSGAIYITDGTFDLNKLVKNDIIEVTGFTNPENNGLFKIINVDAVTNEIKVLNVAAINEISLGTMSFRYTIMAIHITEV